MCCPARSMALPVRSAMRMGSGSVQRQQRSTRATAEAKEKRCPTSKACMDPLTTDDPL